MNEALSDSFGATSISRANSATVGFLNRVSSCRFTSRRARTRATTWPPRRESPPRAKKLSVAPTCSTPRTSAKSAATSVSVSPRGVTNFVARRSASRSASPRRWILPVAPFRNLVHDYDPARNLEVRQTAEQEPAQLVFCRACPGLQDDRRRDVLPKRGMGNRKGGRLPHGAMLEQRFLHVARGHLLAAPVDDLLEPARDGQIAVRVEPAQVAGAEPAVDERSLIGFGV